MNISTRMEIFLRKMRLIRARCNYDYKYINRENTFAIFETTTRKSRLRPHTPCVDYTAYILRYIAEKTSGKSNRNERNTNVLKLKVRRDLSYSLAQVLVEIVLVYSPFNREFEPTLFTCAPRDTVLDRCC